MTNLLIIDDTAEERDYICRLLRDRQDLKLHATATSREGLQMLQRTAIDCVLLDYRLGDEDGLDVLGKLLEERPSCPVIMLTGMGSEKIAAQAMAAGASYYLSKDNLDEGLMAATIDRAIEQARQKTELTTQRAALERANRLDAIGQLAAGIAHDFNNLLATSQYALDLVLSDDLPAKSRERLSIMQTSLKRGVSLTSRLLSFSRIGDYSSAPRQVSLLFAEMEEIIHAAVSKSISVHFEETPSDLFVVCDHSQLADVLINLILNARDAIEQSKRGGRITVSASGPMPASDGRGAQIKITVRDDGPGMRPDVLAKCTDPFFTTKENDAGTGLGLAMALTFATKAGGELRIRSEYGAGATVDLYLPSVSVVSEDTEKRPPVPVEAQVGGAKILLVEDQLSLRHMIETILSESGYTVASAASGGEALELAENRLFDLLVTDIQMPGMSGVELAQNLRRRRPDLPVIYLTGYADDPALTSQEIFGPILQKPVPQQKFLGEIAAALAHS